jgi:hypothetical protein
MKLVVVAAVAALALGGCALGVGQIHMGKGSRRAGDNVPTECTEWHVIYYADGTYNRSCIASRPIPGATPTHYDYDTKKLRFGVATGVKTGFGNAAVAGTRTSGLANDFFSEVVVVPTAVGFAVEAGYTRQPIDDVKQDATFGGWYVAGKVLVPVPVGGLTAYAGVGPVWGDLDGKSATGFRLLGGVLMKWKIARQFDLIPRFEVQYTAASETEYSATALMFCGAWMF